VFLLSLCGAAWLLFIALASLYRQDSFRAWMNLALAGICISGRAGTTDEA